MSKAHDRGNGGAGGRRGRAGMEGERRCRRRHSRSPLKLPAMLYVLGGDGEPVDLWAVFVRDISASGIGMMSARAVPAGTRVVVQILDGKGETLRVMAGRAVHTRPAGKDWQWLGLQFTGAPERSRVERWSLGADADRRAA